MKVYVVVGGWVYEGYDKPSAVFSDRQGAEDYAATVDDGSLRGFYYEVLEYEVVEPKTGEGSHD